MWLLLRWTLHICSILYFVLGGIETNQGHMMSEMRLSSFPFTLRRVTLNFTSCLRLSRSMGAITTQTVNTTARLAALRELMSKKEYNVDVFVVPSEDQRKLSVHRHQFWTANSISLFPYW